MAIPSTLPAHAPTPSVGMKIPAGTLMPKVTIVSAPLTTMATRIARATGQTAVRAPGSMTQRPEWVLPEPVRHSAKRL